MQCLSARHGRRAVIAIGADDEQTCYAEPRHSRRGALDQQGQRCPPVPVGEIRRRSGRDPPGTILFVHGSSMASQPTFDLQVPGRHEFSAMDFFAARGYDTWCVDMEGYGRSTKTPRQQRADRARRRRLLRGRQLYRDAARPASAPGLRDLVRRAARGAVRAAASRDGRAARARRHGVDRRRLADARRAAQAVARIPAQKPAADRPRLRAFDLHPRPSRHRRRRRDRGVRGRHPQARRFGADRHLRRHVRASSGLRPGEDQGGRRSSCAASTTASPASRTW